MADNGFCICSFLASLYSQLQQLAGSNVSRAAADARFDPTGGDLVDVGQGGMTSGVFFFFVIAAVYMAFTAMGGNTRTRNDSMEKPVNPPGPPPSNDDGTST